jgi:hypothetical protein
MLKRALRCDRRLSQLLGGLGESSEHGPRESPDTRGRVSWLRNFIGSPTNVRILGTPASPVIMLLNERYVRVRSAVKLMKGRFA